MSCSRQCIYYYQEASEKASQKVKKEEKSYVALLICLYGISRKSLFNFTLLTFTKPLLIVYIFRWTLEKDTGHLIAYHLKKEDEGKYVCIAENNAGRIETETFLVNIHFLNFGTLKESIFLTTFYGLYF